MALDTRMRNCILEEKALKGYFFSTLCGLIILSPTPTVPIAGKQHVLRVPAPSTPNNVLSLVDCEQNRSSTFVKHLLVLL